MVEAVLLQPWVQDVPVCLPERMCVDQTPIAAPLITATTALTPLTPLIAVALLAATSVALVLVVAGLHQQWRMRGAPRWPVILAATMLLFGVSTSWSVRSRLAVIAVIYSDAFGQPAAPVPPSLIGSWPAVLASGCAMSALGSVALIATIGAAFLERRRPATPGRPPRLPS